MPPLQPGRGRMRLFVAKDEHKFSCAHMTVFADGTKERLHGHNYHVGCAVEIEPAHGALMLDFALVKRTLAGLCEELREHLLVPRLHPLVVVVGEAESSELELRVCGRRYVLPADEVMLLPVANLVVEELAAWLWQRVAAALEPDFRAAQVAMLEVTVTESPGQGATWAAPLPTRQDQV